MPALRNPKHEIVAQELAAGHTPEQASETAKFPKGSSFAANARKRAQRKDIKARVAEIQEPMAERAGITAEYLLAKLDNYTDYNIDDYLTADENGRRFLDVSNVPRQTLSRLSELSQEVMSLGGKRSKLRTITKTKIKGYDPIGAMRLMAQIAGLLKPEKVELTGKDGTPITPTINLFGRPESPPAS